ncbi:MAG TPA: terminase small subunit [Spirochaetia bacterium]|nr:terminase small subunit [Spirochaetia bacterium]
MPKLTPMQKRFCDAYIKERTGTAAAIAAGYSKKTAKEIASQNLTKPKIQAYLAKRMKRHERPTIASQEEVLETLTAIMRQQKYDSVVIRTAKGYVIVAVPNKVSDAYKAADALARRYGLYVPEQKDEETKTSGIVEIPAVMEAQDGAE